MRRLLAFSTLSLCLGSALPAQTGIPLSPPVQVIERPIPASIPTNGNAVRVVSFDPDGDLLHDVAILWSSGDLTFCHAPEILPSFAACPVSGTGIAKIPATVAGGHDGLLVANGIVLNYLTFDNTTGFTVTPVNAPQPWKEVGKVEAFLVGPTCWLLGLAPDQTTIRIGQWGPQSIVNPTSVTAGAYVQQMLVMSTMPGTVQIVARTNAGLEMWNADGTQFGTPIPAPTPGALGALTSFHDVINNVEVQRLAWVVQSNSDWLLRVLIGPIVHEEIVLAALDLLLPPRFHPVGIGAMALDTSGSVALVLNQNSTDAQIVLEKDSSGYFVPTSAFHFPGMTYPADNCPAIFDDIDNDRWADCTTVIAATPRRLQIATGIPLSVNHVNHGAPPPSDTPDFLPDPHIEIHMWHVPEVSETIDLCLQVPDEYNHPEYAGMQAQVVAWRQMVVDPTGEGPGGYDPQPMTLEQHSVYILGGGVTGPCLHPILSLVLPRTIDRDDWSPNEEYFFMVRLILGDPGNDAVFSSPAQVVGFVAGPQDMPDICTNYMESISSAPGTRLSVHGDNRNVGVILKPPSVNPPNSTIDIPNPSSVTPVPITQTWQ